MWEIRVGYRQRKPKQNPARQAPQRWFEILKGTLMQSKD
jgi:hypothetical protein